MMTTMNFDPKSLQTFVDSNRKISEYKAKNFNDV